jgi:hypothetical protein
LRFGQQNGFAIAKIAGINPQYQSDGPRTRWSCVMNGLFDVSKEIILMAGASQGWAASSRAF